MENLTSLPGSRAAVTQWDDVNNVTDGVIIEPSCVRREITGILGLMIIPLAALLVNVTMTVAAYLYRSKLRQKNVYIYVYSTLAANAVFSLLCVYQLLNHHFAFEGNPTLLRGGDGEAPKGSQSLRAWWSFRKALLVSMFLTMMGNIGILIHAIQDGSLIVAKSSTIGKRHPEPGVDHDRHLVRKLKGQRRKAYVLVAVVWLFPTAMAVCTITGWHCMNECECLSGCYQLRRDDHIGRKCSRIWTPMTNTYMGVVVIFWALEFLILFALICQTFQTSVTSGQMLAKTKYVESEPPLKDHKSNGCSFVSNEWEITRSYGGGETPRIFVGCSQEEEEEEEEEKECSMEEGRTVTTPVEYETLAVPQSLQVTKHQSKSKKSLALSTASDVKRKYRRTHAMWLRNAAKHLLILTLIFFVCTLPAMVAIAIDLFTTWRIALMTSSLLLALPLIYCMICPILLMRHLGGLKAAVNIFFIQIATSHKRPSNSKTSQQPRSTSLSSP